jgi:hypothetical protein
VQPPRWPRPSGERRRAPCCDGSGASGESIQSAGAGRAYRAWSTTAVEATAGLDDLSGPALGGHREAVLAEPVSAAPLAARCGLTCPAYPFVSGVLVG